MDSKTQNPSESGEDPEEASVASRTPSAKASRLNELQRLACGTGLALGLMLGIFRVIILTPELAGKQIVAGAAILAGGLLQDWLLAAGLALIAFSIGHFFDVTGKWARGVLLALGAFILLIGLANIRAVKMLDGPLTLHWLAYADLGESSFMLSSVASEITVQRLLAAAVLLAVFLGLSQILSSLCSQLRLGRVALAAMAIAALSAAFGPGATSGRVANPVLAFSASLFDSASLRSTVSEALGEDVSLRDKSEFAGLRMSALPRPAGDPDQIRNVVVYVMESVGTQVATGYGGDFELTPNFARLADEMGLRFSDVYAHAPASNYSLVSILAGIEPDLWSTSMTVNRDDLQIRGLPSVLAVRGMRTAYFNSNDKRFQNAGGFAQKAGFEVIRDSRDWDCALGGLQYTGTDEPLDKKHDLCTVAEVTAWIDSEPDRPFFVTLWTGMAHYPYFAGPDPVRYVDDSDHNDYLNAVRVIDEGLGQLVENLRQRDLLDSTLVIVLGDHGEGFGEHGQRGHATGLWEENLHVPIALLNPRLFQGGEMAEVIGSLADVAPTITDLLGLDPVPEWHGQSFFSESRPEGVFLFSPWGGFRIGFRTGDRKFILNANTGEALLFDLSKDPHEQTNLAETNPAALEEARRDLAAWVNWQTAYRSQTARGSLTKSAVEGKVDVVVRASGTRYLSAPWMRLHLDGKTVGNIEVTGAVSNAEAVASDEAVRAAFADLYLQVDAPSCPRVLEVEFLNDEWAGEGKTGDTDLYVERITFAGVNYYPNLFRLVTDKAGSAYSGLFRMSRYGRFAIDLDLPPECLVGAVKAP